MSELSHYYENFRTAYWRDEDPEVCRCKGHGWALSEVDTWHQCPTHYCGQLHPEADCGSEEEQAAEDLRSRSQWAVDRGLAMWLPSISNAITVPDVAAAAGLDDEDEIPF